jgi:hypothetical protein
MTEHPVVRFSKKKKKKKKKKKVFGPALETKSRMHKNSIV